MKHKQVLHEVLDIMSYDDRDEDVKLEDIKELVTKALEEEIEFSITKELDIAVGKLLSEGYYPDLITETIKMLRALKNNLTSLRTEQLEIVEELTSCGNSKDHAQARGMISVLNAYDNV